MKRIDILWIILNSVFLIIFNAVFFVTGGVEHNISVWLSYGFIHFAYFMLLLTSKLIRKGKSSVIFGFSLYSISVVYFVAQFVIGMLFIYASPESYITAFWIQICIAGLYGIVLAAYMIADEKTAKAEEKRQYQIEYVKNASEKLKNLMDRISDKGTKKKLEKVYDALYSSPVKSNPSLSQIENHIVSLINELSEAVTAGSKERIIMLADSLLTDIKERNTQIKARN